MRFLADESCDFHVVRALRTAGHDVMTVVETAPGVDDASVIEMALREERIFITEDRDFGQLIYAAMKPALGVILLRFPAGARRDLASSAVKLVDEHANRLRDRFVVVQPGQVRFGGAPRG